MSFFSKLKQKLFSVKKTPLATALLVLFFVLFYPQSVDAWFPGESFVSGTLKLILDFVVILLSIAETIFEWIVDANTMTTIINNNAVYQTWRSVRDVFNIAFIMVLLFSAFATVFQVSKYNYKAVLQNLIIMALLVNFSYPIARFIVDVSNVIMYGFLQNMGDEASFVSVIERSGITKFATTESPSLVFLFFTIIFTFIFGMTLLIIAILLVIRTITLAVYIMFSPIAFVGSILPGTKLASTGSEWWTKFMQACFSGPIMVFMLFVANSLMIAVMELKTGKLNSLAGTQTGGVTEANFLQQLIINASFFSLPIVVLWLGIIEAQKSGLAGANAVVSGGIKAGKWLANSPLKQSGVSGAVKQKYDNFKKAGVFGSDRRAEREAFLAGKGPFKVKGAAEELERKKIAETRKEWKDQGGATDDDISSALSGNDAMKKKAAAMEAAEKAGFGDKDHADANYIKAKEAVENSPTLKALFNSKVKEKHIKLVMNDEIRSNEKAGNGISAKETYSKYLSGMNADDFAKQKGLHENINEDPNLQNYIRDEVAPDTEYHKEVFKKFTRKQREAYIKGGLNPEASQQQSSNQTTSQPKQSYRDIQAERARKADKEINKPENQSDYEREQSKRSHEDIQAERARKADEEIKKHESEL